jgi:hypothetical protein
MKVIDVIGLPSHQRAEGINGIIDALRQSGSGLEVVDFLEGEVLRKTGARSDFHGHAVLVLNGTIPASRREEILETARQYDPHAFLHLTSSGGNYATSIAPRPEDTAYGYTFHQQSEIEDDTRLHT